MRYPAIFLCFVLTILGFLPEIAEAQAPKKMTSAELHEAIKKLNFLGSALYIAAHPDDENTRMIAYLSNEVKANVAYLSLTRGDGGQNLIGPEIRELLGLIRTQELLGARRIDGGSQMFTRANDFGYSKHPDETLKIWDKDKVLADVVWGIRKWRPDVIINRFDHRSPGTTHGHHTSSAMLSVEAFELVNDPQAYPDQLKYVEPWQPKRLFFNTSWWFYGSREKFEEADKTNLMSVDVGVYYPFAGKSNNEIAGESRSMHKSQGFGSSGDRGSQQEYLELLKGEMPATKTSLFEGINTSWSRVPGGEGVGKVLARVEQEFDHNTPSKSIDDLLTAYKLLRSLPDSYWRTVKLKELKTVIYGCLGLFLEPVAEDYSATPGEDVELSIEVLNRSAEDVKLLAFDVYPAGFDTTVNMALADNVQNKFFKTVQLPGNIDPTNPYWLNKEGTLGLYSVEDQELIGLPETPRAFKVNFEMEINGVNIDFSKDVVYKRTDPVDGEVYRPFEVTAPVFTNLAEKVYIFAGNSSKSVSVVIRAGKDSVKGQLYLEVPEGWRVQPQSLPFSLERKGEERRLSFDLFPPINQSEGYVYPIAEVEGQNYQDEIVLIEYDHIPTQTVVQKAKAKAVKIDIKKEGNRIGYIMGAGDAIPVSLEQIGYEVTLLEENDMNVERFQEFDAIIVGIRAYNTNERLKFHQAKLMEYVKTGGTMIVQYNTTRRLKIDMDKIGPYPLELSRDRVAVEEAEVRFLAPDHPVLNFPNKITPKDFEGWVQERGLYFPDEWSENYTAILSSNDPGEPARDGGLLVAEYGKGYYIYSGYSWFRELPAGVPGAFRLFANLISIGQRDAEAKGDRE